MKRLTCLAALACSCLCAAAAPKSKAISPNLFGIFFEDLNYAADGGLYAEMVQNRSFEYLPSDVDAVKNKRGEYNPFTAWAAEKTHSLMRVSLESERPLNTHNRHYCRVQVLSPGDDGAGLSNNGYDGMAIKSGARYDFSVFLRLATGESMPAEVKLVASDKQHTVLAKQQFTVNANDWKQYQLTLTATADCDSAKLFVMFKHEGTVDADMVSLFPQDTFKGRKNGLRRDLAETIADLHPAFMRFPGGCLAHGDGIDNIYRWKRTIGPVEQREADSNIWNYQQSFGLGYYEYLCFCEDIGAKPLPVLAAGVSCQNSSRRRGDGQQAVPMEQMGQYIQDVLDLIEYCNGAPTTTWGSRRAEAGHPEPFNLEYIGIGNEDHITPEFEERYAMIVKAIRKQYPKIKIVGTSGPSHKGWDFEHGWAASRREKLDIVDEHYYCSPSFFLSNFKRYDTYDRRGPKVYLGEYASWGNKLYNAIAEAAYMTQLERNGDIVEFASYAPLLARHGHTQWNPDMIYFDSRRVYPTANYYVQRLFGQNAGVRYISGIATTPDSCAMSTVQTREGDIVVKLVNYSASAQNITLRLAGLVRAGQTANVTTLTGDKDAKNTKANPELITPQASRLTARSTNVPVAMPAYSLTVIRFSKQK